MSNIFFVELPIPSCNRIVYEKKGKVLTGDYPTSDETKKLIDYGVEVWVNLSLDDNLPTDQCRNTKDNNNILINRHIPHKGVGKDIFLFDLVEDVYNLLKKGKTIYIFGGNGCNIFASCFLMRCNGWDYEKSIDRCKLLYLTRESPNSLFSLGNEQIRQISRYRPPVKVIVSGDRDSANSFIKIIRQSLKNLPRGSIVIHGACKGIDTMAGKIATELGLRVKEYPITKEEWNCLGKSAGPIRNKRMLKENPNYVLAFHPDIIHSKGTKDMVISAYSKGIDVYIYDLKLKRKFKGNFNDM